MYLGTIFDSLEKHAAMKEWQEILVPKENAHTPGHNEMIDVDNHVWKPEK